MGIRTFIFINKQPTFNWVTNINNIMGPPKKLLLNQRGSATVRTYDMYNFTVIIQLIRQFRVRFSYIFFSEGKLFKHRVRTTRVYNMRRILCT